MKADCPKCGNPNASYIRKNSDLVLRCLCGFWKVVYSELEVADIEHADTAGKVKLPRRETKLWNCLAVMVGLEQAGLVEVTERYNLLYGDTMGTADMATQLTVLRLRGLVSSLDSRRGIPGGSTWVPTGKAVELFWSVNGVRK